MRTKGAASFGQMRQPLFLFCHAQNDPFYLVQNGKGWDQMDGAEQLEALKKAHTAGHNAAVKWYKKLHGIK